jgi:hypothetical protein
VKDTPLAMSSSPIPQQRRTSRSSRARS